jgi:hypothetical protein
VYAVSVASPTNVWALADDANCELYILHYNGSRWGQVSREDNCEALGWDDYGQITAAGASSAWAVGGGGFDYGEEEGAEATCFGACPLNASTGLDGGSTAYFTGSAGTPSDLWAFGKIDESTPFAEHWDGTTWETDSPSFGYATQHEIRRGVVLPDGDLWAVGDRTAPGGERTLILEHSSAGWSDLGGRNLGTGDNALASVAHVRGTPTEMWAVGVAAGQPLLLHHR